MMVARHKKKRRGATPARSAARAAIRQWSWRPLRPVGYTLLAIAIACAAMLGVQALQQVPIARVAFTGSLQHTEHRELVAQVQPFLDEGFVGVDLSRISAALKQLPWVDQVRIRRMWPNELQVEITEQQPIARWAENGLVNQQGDVFRPLLDGVDGLDDLPRLNGPDEDAAKIMKQFRQLGELLRPRQLDIQALSQSARGDWRLELNNGVIIALAQADVLNQMRRFLQVYELALKPQFDNIANIDMRYVNGMAVAWRDDNKRGGSGNHRAAGEKRNG